jgi:hypothetical protein
VTELRHLIQCESAFRKGSRRWNGRRVRAGDGFRASILAEGNEGRVIPGMLELTLASRMPAHVQDLDERLPPLKKVRRICVLLNRLFAKCDYSGDETWLAAERTGGANVGVAKCEALA